MENANKYKPLEQIIWEKEVVPLTNLAVDLGKSAYHPVAAILRIPTTIRKFLNKQIKMQREPKSFSLNIGTIFGIGMAVHIPEIVYSNAVDHHNYIPLAILTGTNIISGIYELGRLKQSQREYSELNNQLGDKEKC